MSKGLDTASDTRAHIACIQAAGYEWIGRYLASHTVIPGKILSPVEAQAIAAAGLEIVSIWENGSPTSASYFTAMRGASDGVAACRLAESLGQPSGGLIYATVDYDATHADLVGPIADYFGAFVSGLGPYRCGVYGSGLTCITIVDDGYATAGWLSEANGWAGYSGYRNSNGWAIAQWDGTVCGLPSDVTDMDIGQGAFGAWQPTQTVA
jgi:hypothetical protein